MAQMKVYIVPIEFDHNLQKKKGQSRKRVLKISMSSHRYPKETTKVSSKSQKKPAKFKRGLLCSAARNMPRTIEWRWYDAAFWYLLFLEGLSLAPLLHNKLLLCTLLPGRQREQLLVELSQGQYNALGCGGGKPQNLSQNDLFIIWQLLWLLALNSTIQLDISQIAFKEDLFTLCYNFSTKNFQ